MYRIRRFGIMKTATVVAAMYLLVGAVVLIPVVLLITAGVRGDGGSAPLGAAVFGVLILAVVYAVVAFVFTAIACAIYNLVAGWVGGIEVQVEAVSPPPPPPTWGPINAAPPPAQPPAPPAAWGGPGTPPPAG